MEHTVNKLAPNKVTFSLRDQETQNWTNLSPDRVYEFVTEALTEEKFTGVFIPVFQGMSIQILYALNVNESFKEQVQPFINVDILEVETESKGFPFIARLSNRLRHKETRIQPCLYLMDGVNSLCFNVPWARWGSEGEIAVRGNESVKDVFHTNIPELWSQQPNEFVPIRVHMVFGEWEPNYART